MSHNNSRTNKMEESKKLNNSSNNSENDKNVTGSSTVSSSSSSTPRRTYNNSQRGYIPDNNLISRNQPLNYDVNDSNDFHCYDPSYPHGINQYEGYHVSESYDPLSPYTNHQDTLLRRLSSLNVDREFAQAPTSRQLIPNYGKLDDVSFEYHQMVTEDGEKGRYQVYYGPPLNADGTRRPASPPSAIGLELLACFRERDSEDSGPDRELNTCNASGLNAETKPIMNGHSNGSIKKTSKPQLTKNVKDVKDKKNNLITKDADKKADKDKQVNNSGSELSKTKEMSNDDQHDSPSITDSDAK